MTKCPNTLTTICDGTKHLVHAYDWRTQKPYRRIEICPLSERFVAPDGLILD